VKTGWQPRTLMLLHAQGMNSGVKRNLWRLQNFWPVIVCQLFCFSE